MNKIYKFMHIAAYTTITHGLVYGIFKYFLKQQTEYGVLPHPQQELWQTIHILGSVVLVFGFGLLWQQHIVKMYRNAIIKRKTGLSLVALMLFMIGSGYLVQVIYQPTAKELVAYAHIAVSLLFAPIYLAHHFLGRRS